MVGALRLVSPGNLLITLADHDSVSQLCRPWLVPPPLPVLLEGEHLHCASRDASVHCANALAISLACWVISIDGSGGKDGAPASRGVIVIANDGHLHFKPYTAFAGLFLGPQPSQSVGLVSCNSIIAEALRLLGLCCGLLPSLVDYQS